MAMDKVIRRYSSLAAMKADEYHDWQTLTAQVRLDAVSDMTASAYAVEGRRGDVPRLQRTLVRLQRA
jgi:hypothetical protein